MPKMQEEPPEQIVDEKSQLSDGRLRCLIGWRGIGAIVGLA